MNKIKEIFKKIKNMFKRIITGSDRKLLSERGFSKISGNSGNNEIYEGVVSPEKSFFYSNGLKLPFGSFKMKNDGSIEVKEELGCTPDGKVWLDGKNIANNELQQRLAERFEQAKEDGKTLSGIMLTRTGGMELKYEEDEEKTKGSPAEEYRKEMYDKEAREATERVSEKYREAQEAQAQEQAQEQEKATTQQRDGEGEEHTEPRQGKEPVNRTWVDENGDTHTEISGQVLYGDQSFKKVVNGTRSSGDYGKKKMKIWKEVDDKGVAHTKIQIRRR